MSMVFDAVILAANMEEVERGFNQIHCSLYLGMSRISDGVFAVYSKGASRSFDFEKDKQVAAQLSKLLGKSLLVLWDDRVDCDRAFLFENGQMTKEFGSPEEWYVLLDEKGQPQIDGPQFTLEELYEGEEYECIRYAIDAGLEALGVSDKVSLQTLMKAFYDFE